MGLERRNARSIGREDVEVGVYEGVKRDASGNIQFASVDSQTNVTTGTTLTGTGDQVSTTLTTAVSRAMASSATVVASTAGTVTNGTVKLKRNGTTLTSATSAALSTGTTLNQSSTFTSTPATWTLAITGVGGGTVTVTSYTVSKEDSR